MPGLFGLFRKTDELRSEKKLEEAVQVLENAGPEPERACRYYDYFGTTRAKVAIEYGVPVTIFELRRDLAKALTERKTVTEFAFGQGVDNLIAAAKAMARHEYLNEDSRSEMGVILRENLVKRIAELRYMAFEEITTEEEFKDKVDQYIKGVA